MSNITITESTTTFDIEFPYNPFILTRVKEIPGRWYDGVNKVWKVPKGSRNQVMLFASKFRVNMSGKEQAPEVVGEIKPLPELNIDIPNLKIQPFPFQKNGIAYILEKKRVIVGDQMGLGKAQPLTSLICTPQGWKQMGEMKKGTEVFGSDGKIYKVTGVFPQGKRPVYKITLNDGFTVECDIDHLWSVMDSNRKKRGSGWAVKSTAQLIESGLHYKGSKERIKSGKSPLPKYHIPITKPVQFDQKKFFIHPYILGMLLGDGSMCAEGRKKSTCISIPDSESESVERIKQLLPKGIKLNVSRHPACPQYYFTQTGTTHVSPVYQELKRLGLRVKGKDKFIPVEYMQGSIDQRKELLKGLMDSDGSAKNNRITFHSCSPFLVSDIAELIQSLGGQVIIRKYDRAKEGKSIEWQVNVRVIFCPFKLKRKAAQWKLAGRNTATRLIYSIDYLGKKETQCIKVDAPDSLYITNNYIITHNTGQAIVAMEHAKPFPCLIICPSSLKLNWQKEISKWTSRKSIILSDNIKSNFQKYYQAGFGDYFIVNFESLKKYFVQEIQKVYPCPKCKKSYQTNVCPVHQSKLEEARLRLNHVKFKDNINLFKSVIIDESHRVKSLAAQQSKFTKGICIGKEYILALTGTPVVNKPIDLISQLGIIDHLDSSFGGYKKFLDRHCSGMKQASNLRELNYKLNKFCFYRRDKSEVLKDLPAKMRQVVICEINTRKEYDDCVADLGTYLAQYKNATEAEIKKSLKGAIMVRIGKLKNISARGKINDVCNYIEDVMESGEKFGLFAHQHEVVDEIKKRFPDALCITGRENIQQREHAVTQFQTNPDAKLILLGIEAAGVGLTLTAGSRCGFIELGWNPAKHDQCEDRFHRIGQEDSVQCDYFIGKNTIDEWIYNDVIEAKRGMTNTITGATEDVEINIIDNFINLFNQPK